MTEMSSRERVLTAFDHREPDRVPRNAPNLVPALYETFVQETGRSDVASFFRSDFRSIEFTPPDELPDFSRYYADVDVPYDLSYSGEYQAEWGVATMSAGFYHFGRPLFPMRNLTTLRDIEEYPFPDYVRDWNHDHFEAQVEDYHNQGFFVTGPVNRTFQTVWMLTGRDKLFVDAVEAPEFVRELFDRVTAVNVAMARRCAEAGVDAISMADDIGMQDRLMISPAWYRKWVKPALSTITAAARRINPKIHVMYHSDGNIQTAIPDLIEAGVTVLSTVQPECMDPAEIKSRFGDRIAMGGTVGVQTSLPLGTRDEVRSLVKEQVETLGVGGGFYFSPANACGPEVPLANVLAMYEAIDEFGSGGGSASG